MRATSAPLKASPPSISRFRRSLPVPGGASRIEFSSDGTWLMRAVGSMAASRCEPNSPLAGATPRRSAASCSELISPSATVASRVESANEGTDVVSGAGRSATNCSELIAPSATAASRVETANEGTELMAGAGRSAANCSELIAPSATVASRVESANEGTDVGVGGRPAQRSTARN